MATAGHFRTTPASMGRHAASLEDELDHCANDCIEAAENVQHLPDVDLQVLRAALQERFPKRVKTAASGSSSDGRPPAVVPLMIHDLIEAVGQMSQWLLVDEPFDDDKERDAEPLDDSNFVAAFEQDCATAGASSLALVPPHARRPFSKELLDEYLTNLSDFPTAAEIRRAYDKAKPYVTRSDADFHRVVENGPLEGINVASSRRLFADRDATEEIYSSALVRLLRRWAYSLGKYFRLLAQCSEQQRTHGHGQVHACGSQAAAQRHLSIQRSERLQAEDDARSVVRQRSPSPLPNPLGNSRHMNASTFVPNASTKVFIPPSHAGELQGSTLARRDESSVRAIPSVKFIGAATRTQSIGVAPVMSDVTSQTDPAAPASDSSEVAGEVASPLRKRAKAVLGVRRVECDEGEERERQKASTETEELRATCTQLRSLVTDLTAERNQLRRQVQRFERATGLELEANMEVSDRSITGSQPSHSGVPGSSTRLSVFDSAIDSHRTMVDEYEARLAAAQQQHEEDVQTILRHRHEISRAERDAARACEDADNVRNQLLSLKQSAQNSVSPARIERLQLQVSRLQEELLHSSNTSREAADNARESESKLNAMQGHASIQRERIAQLTTLLEERDRIIDELQARIADGRAGSSSPTAGRSRMKATASTGTALERDADGATEEAPAPLSSQVTQRSGSSWDSGWVSKRSTAEEKRASLEQREHAALEARRRLKAARPTASRPQRSSSREGDEDDETAERHDVGPRPTSAAGAAIDAVRASTANAPMRGSDTFGEPSSSFEAVRAREANVTVRSPEVSGSMFRAPMRSPGPDARSGSFQPPYEADPVLNRSTRIDGLNPLIREVSAPGAIFTHLSVAAYGSVASDGAVDALLGALIRHQSGRLLQLDLSNCSIMTDTFASNTLVKAIQQLPMLRNVRLDGCDQLSRTTKTAIDALLGERAQARVVDDAVHDAVHRGSTLVDVRGKDLGDGAICRLIDGLLAGGTRCAASVVDLRDNPRMTDDSVVYATQLVETEGPILQIMIDGNPLISDPVARRLNKQAVTKRLRGILGVPKPAPRSPKEASVIIDPYATAVVRESSSNFGEASPAALRSSYSRGSLRQTTQHTDYARASTRSQRLTLQDGEEL